MENIPPVKKISEPTRMLVRAMIKFIGKSESMTDRAMIEIQCTEYPTVYILAAIDHLENIELHAKVAKEELQKLL